MITIGVVDRSKADLFKALAEVDRRKLDGLARAAGYLRSASRRSMRRRKSSSKPGQPPSARTDRKNGQPLRNLMAWGLDLSGGMEKAVAVVGPLPLEGSAKQNQAPRLHEFGGWMKNTLHRDLKVGSGAVIAVISSAGPAKRRSYYDDRRLRQARRWNAKTIKQVRAGPKTTDQAWVIFTKLRTPRQVAIAKAIQEDLWGAPMVWLPRRSFLAKVAERVSGGMRSEFAKAMAGKASTRNV